MIGEPLTNGTKLDRVEDRINGLTNTTKHMSVELFSYSFAGFRLEIPTDGTHVVPDDIEQITEHTDWSFTGCKDGSVLFEGNPDTL